MYPGHGAPYRLDLPEARAGLGRIRSLLENGVIVKHPEGGKAEIEGYADGVWQGFGQVAQGLWGHIMLTHDDVIKEALDRLLWAICGFEVRVSSDGRIGFVRYEPLKEALDNLEAAIISVPTRWTLKPPDQPDQP